VRLRRSLGRRSQLPRDVRNPLAERRRLKLLPPRQFLIAAQRAQNLVDSRFQTVGFVVEPDTPAALARRTQVETAKWAKAVKEAKIEPQ